jgi:ryanodine receptor 2
LTISGEDAEMSKVQESEGVWIPRPVDDSKIGLSNDLSSMTTKFAEHFHDSWSSRKLEKGWIYGELYSRRELTHPRLLPFRSLKDYVS